MDGSVKGADQERTAHEDRGTSYCSADSKPSPRSGGSNASSRWTNDAPPLQLNYEGLRHIATYYLPGWHGACTEITTMQRGAFHEIRELHFVDGWSCIARFTRMHEILEKMESELATMAYVKAHTTIPVPDVYFVNFNSDHVVGAPFVLMEKMSGVALVDLWLELSLEHKLAVMRQLGSVIGRLAELKFDCIGSFRMGGTMGPLISPAATGHIAKGSPFSNTYSSMASFLQDDDAAHPEEARAVYPAIKADTHSFLNSERCLPIYNAPYRLIHYDFNMQNMLFSHDDKTKAPQLTAIIDWDWAATGLIYDLCEYPGWLEDQDYREGLWIENWLLRKQFVSGTLHQFQKHSADRLLVRQCFREKNFRFNRFRMIFKRVTWTNPAFETALVKGYAKFLQDENKGDETGRSPYEVEDWQPDSEPESEDG